MSEARIDMMAQLAVARRKHESRQKERDELFQLMIGRTTTKAVERILAAGYRKPRQVTTVEELDALEDPETVLVDFKQNAYQWGIGLDGSEGWQSTRDPNPITSNHLWRFAPLTVLHVGGAE